MCQRGIDVLDTRADLSTVAKYQQQNFIFRKVPSIDPTISGNTQTFALTFKSKLNESFTTQPINMFKNSGDFHTFIDHIRTALLRLPNRVIDGKLLDQSTIDI